MVNKTDSCWLWSGSTGKGRNTYGHFSGYGRQKVRAHRFSWELHFGKIPNGMFVCHSCDTPRCVRPDHLFLGNDFDNMRDAAGKGRLAHIGMRGSEHPMSKLTEADVIAIRSLYVPWKRGNRVELANKFGVSVDCINQVIWNRRWLHVPIRESSHLPPSVRP